MAEASGNIFNGIGLNKNRPSLIPVKTSMGLSQVVFFPPLRFPILSNGDWLITDCTQSIIDGQTDGSNMHSDKRAFDALSTSRQRCSTVPFAQGQQAVTKWYRTWACSVISCMTWPVKCGARSETNHSILPNEAIHCERERDEISASGSLHACKKVYALRSSLINNTYL